MESRSLGTHILDRDPALARRGQRLEVAAVGSDHHQGNLLYAAAPDGRTFGALAVCGPASGRGRLTSGVAMACWDENRTDIFGVGEIGGRRGLLHWWTAYDEALSGPELLPCGLSDRTPAAVAVQEGELHILAVDVDGRLWHWHVLRGGFNGPWEVAKDASRGVSATLAPNQVLQVVSVDRQGRATLRSRISATGQWSSQPLTVGTQFEMDRPPPLASWGSSVLLAHASASSGSDTVRIDDVTGDEQFRDVPLPNNTSRNPMALATNDYQVLLAYTGSDFDGFHLPGRRPLAGNPAPAFLVMRDRRTNGSYAGPPLHRKKPPNPLLTLSDWTWRLEIDEFDKHADYVIVQPRPGSGTPATWSQQVLEEISTKGSANYLITGHPGTLREGPVARPLLSAELQRVVLTARRFALLVDYGRAEYVDTWFDGVFTGPRPDPGEAPLSLLVWLLNVSRRDRYGRSLHVLSEPTNVLVPPIGDMSEIKDPSGPIRGALGDKQQRSNPQLPGSVVVTLAPSAAEEIPTALVLPDLARLINNWPTEDH